MLDSLQYLTGFGNEHASEAVAGALPLGRNSPQRAPLGLFAEQLSGTAFTTPRAENRRTWLYRIRPSAAHPEFQRCDIGNLKGTPFESVHSSPNRLRWDPQPLEDHACDFLDGLATVAGNGDIWAQRGIAVHLYSCNRSMERYFSSSDGELLIVPETGGLQLHTELGILHVAPGEIALIPRGVRFRVEISDRHARGYVGENFGSAFTLPELGPLGSNGLANARDFLTPVAAFEDADQPVEVVTKYGGTLWHATYDHSPLDVVAWHGSYVPVKYDLANFNTVGSVSYDHPDPSIFTVLTSPSAKVGTANADFVIFPARWIVAEQTFRPPWFHRNVMSELMGLVHGEYDAKSGGFVTGGVSIHNALSAHGPDVTSFERGVMEDQVPQYLGGTLAFMFESRYAFHPTAWAMARAERQHEYDSCWSGFTPRFQASAENV